MAFDIIQGHRELAAQALEHRFVILLPEVGDDFRVAVSDEVMAARRQLRAPLDVIEQLAVEDHKDAPVFVGDRLLAIGKTDDAESPRGEGHTGAMKEALFVRPAMHQSLGHAFDDAFGNSPPPYQIHYSGNATHRSGA